jgi:hypothetical protein
MTITPTTKKKIVTKYDPKPIPVRNFDWVAWFDDEEEKGEYGYGKTELEAVSELLDEYSEMYTDYDLEVKS